MTTKEQAQIEARLYRIKAFDHFGDCKYLEGTNHAILELRWKNGRRIYYSLIPEEEVLLLLGGNKNGQTKDINKAEKIYKEWVDD